ncbi:MULTISPECIES: hypothetical protein [Enterococcus]|nr:MULTISPECIES: hypothetical protein [Enterococcus]
MGFTFYRYYIFTFDTLTTTAAIRMRLFGTPIASTATTATAKLD